MLIRNRDKVSADVAAKVWTDLLDPRWKGQLSVAHPAFSGWPAPLDAQAVIALTAKEIRKGLPEVIEQWRDTFGG